MPTATLSLSTRDPSFLVVMAYYHAVKIAAASYLPKVSAALFLRKKAQVIGNIWTELVERQKLLEQQSPTSSTSNLGWSIDDAVEMAVLPLVYAVRYRARRASVGVSDV